MFTFTRAPEYRTIISDFHRARVGNGTANIIFSQVSHAPSAQILGNIIEEKVELVLSWTQLKMVSMNLASIVKAIETEIGPIPVPQGYQVIDANNQLAVRSLGYPSPKNISSS
jgi:hypothetical protein